MVEKLAEVNRVRIADNKLGDAEGAANIDAVIEHCKGTVIEARIPKHEVSISFAEQIGLLVTDGAVIRLTSEGVGFIEFNPTGQYDLSDGQKRILLRTCYLHGPLREQARNILKEFSPALEGDALCWSLYDSSPFPNEWAAEHLSQLGLLQRREGGWEVTADYTRTVGIFLEEGGGGCKGKLREYP